MATFLFDSVIFGPVKSRRLGASLGINLLPTSSKICNYNCIYCECGLNKKADVSVMPTRREVRDMLETKLCEMMLTGEKADVLTFAGNGEPTLHPEFADIVSDVIFLKEAYMPLAKIAVLSNATMLHKKEVVQALQKVDMNILKIDSAIEETFLSINQPNSNVTLEQIIEGIKKFKGNFILQTMFVKAKINTLLIDNTEDEEIEKWLDLIALLKPQMVMIYTIEREPASASVKKIPLTKLQSIAAKVKELGIKVQVSG